MIQIYGTIGPNCRTQDIFESMLHEGMNGSDSISLTALFSSILRSSVHMRMHAVRSMSRSAS